ncbi:MAG: class I SAM-dependent methyltransferase [Candidatus Magasanikbacteria bacterium]|nr:class I SAM-dependent methyltransferase [Candidatus Magasanikbacteria bacterium]
MNLVFLFFLIILITYAYAGRQGAPWVPTKKTDVERFLKLANIKPGQKMYDLGCGDGRLVCAAAQAGAKAEGLELSLLPFFLAHFRRLFQKNKKNIKFSFKNLWTTNFSDADLVYLYLTPHIYPQLKQKLEKELRPGTKIIAYVWPIVGWVPQQVDLFEGHPKMYLYQI